MRVTHVIKATRISGAERHLLILLPYLCKAGIDAQLVILVEPDNPMEEMVDEATRKNIFARRITIRKNIDGSVMRELRRLFREQQPDIVHTHLIHADAYGIPAASWARVPVIITGRHNDDAFRRRGLIRRVNRWLWRSVKAGIAVSEAIRQFAIEVEKASPEKIHVAHYGIEHQPITGKEIQNARARLRKELNLSPDSCLLGMACRLTEQKGITYAIRALDKVKYWFPNTHLVIAGDGELREALESQVDQLGMSACVHFLGWRENVPDIIAGFDILLMPSLWEGFGLVMLEAMSRRIPIIGSNISAIPEIVRHEETGLLVPPQNPDALAEGIYHLLNDRQLRLHFGLLGEYRLETVFNAERMANETMDIYRRLLASRHGTS